MLINEVKKEGVNVEDSKGQAGGRQREDANEPGAANTGLERSSSKQLNGTMFVGGLCCNCVEKKNTSFAL